MALQLRRGLRIRRSAEQRVIRSPSARKIGAIRRRSRDSPRTSLSGAPDDTETPTRSRRLTRSQSMLPARHLTIPAATRTPRQSIGPTTSHEIRSGLRRGKPNTLRTGLRDPLRAPSFRSGKTCASEEATTPTTSWSKTEVGVPAAEVVTPTTSRSEVEGGIQVGQVEKRISVVKLAQHFSVAAPATTPAATSFQATSRRTVPAPEEVQTSQLHATSSGKQETPSVMLTTPASMISPQRTSRKVAKAPEDVQTSQPSTTPVQLHLISSGNQAITSQLHVSSRITAPEDSQTSQQTVATPVQLHATTSSNDFVTPDPSCKWTSADVFHKQFDHLRAPLTGRPSVQKIRSENIGKVSAWVRKFDKLASPSITERRTSLNGPSPGTGQRRTSLNGLAPGGDQIRRTSLNSGPTSGPDHRRISLNEVSERRASLVQASPPVSKIPLRANVSHCTSARLSDSVIYHYFQFYLYDYCNKLYCFVY